MTLNRTYLICYDDGEGTVAELITDSNPGEISNIVFDMTNNDLQVHSVVELHQAQLDSNQADWVAQMMVGDSSGVRWHKIRDLSIFEKDKWLGQSHVGT